MNGLLPKYEEPPPWIPIQMRKGNPLYDNRLTLFMPRLIYMRKSTTDAELGFNIRGGINEFANIFVSKVYPKTMAYQCGLNEGDQLVSVNGVDFRVITHYDAVRMFKENVEFLIVAKYSPYDFKRVLAA